MLKIAGIQLSCGEDKAYNLQQAVNLAQLAAEKGARIICFQQLLNLPWFAREINEEHFALAETLQGETVSAFSSLAGQSGAVFVCPIFEKTAQGKYYNSAVVIDGGGEILGQYRKIHVPDLPLWKESFYFEPGDLGFPVFKTRYATIGVQLCWDTFYPEGFRILALKGAQIVFCPTASAYATQQRWKKVLSGHAISNNFYIMRVNRVGKEEKQEFYGNSLCIDPYGELQQETGNADQSILLCEVDLNEVDNVRRHWTFFQNRRPEEYQAISALQE